MAKFVATYLRLRGKCDTNFTSYTMLRLIKSGKYWLLSVNIYDCRVWLIVYDLVFVIE